MKKSDKIIKIALSVFYTVVVYLFWAIPYRAVLSYHEQFQLFLLDSHYLQEHMSWPGGMATYLAEFLVQLFNNYWIGALVVALSLLSIQILTWTITCRYTQSYDRLRYVLSFLPSVSAWILMGDVNYMFSYTIALILVLIAFVGYTSIRGEILSTVIIVCGMPLIYWIVGAMIYLLAALICVDMLICRSKTSVKVLGCVTVLAYTVALVLVSSIWLKYPVYQVIIGINYYRLLVTLPAMMVAVPVITLLTLVACVMLKFIPKGKAAHDLWGLVIATLIIGVLTWIGIHGSYDSRIKELTDYDYLIRTNNWNEIILKAERHAPNTPLSLCATNFALGITGQLCDRAFELDQHGVEGLIPTFQRDANSSLVLGEIFYQLGMINSAQRLTFEAMEAITNYNKSSRCIKRLVETNMIRGDYGVAEKYLKLLDKTMMYRKWAQRMRQLMATPGAIDEHPLYGKLRKRQLDDSFLFSETEMDKIMGQLVLHDPDNTLATQYLLMYPLMQRDLDNFMSYLAVVQKTMPYYRPKICQQGVAMAYVNAGLEIPHGLIDAMIMQQFSDFAQTMTSQGKDSPAMDRFSNTLWYYLVK